MATGKILARDYVFEVQNPDTEEFVELPNISSFEWSVDTNNTDVTTFDSRGRNTEVPVSQMQSVSFEGFRTLASGELHEAQGIIQASAMQLGYEGRRDYRMSHRNAAVASGELTFSAWASLDGFGGGNDDFDPFNFTLNIDGETLVGTGVFAAFTTPE